jgi:hypothetical protein
VPPPPAQTSSPPLSSQILDAYAGATTDLVVGHERLSRLAVLGRLSVEPNGQARRDLFLALEPAWRSIAGDGSPEAPYRRLLRLSAARWAAGHSPVRANATALGISPASIEPTLVSILRAWRDATANQPPLEPWDWWHANGAAERALRHVIPRDRIGAVSAAYCAALGADLDRLDVSFDVTARIGRPPVPVAYTTFGGRPGAASDAAAAGPWVFASYSKGGLGELTELIHETGHAIHIAAIQTRPAFADWPDSDALTEALAEIVALDTAEPAWQERWLGASAPQETSLRDRYGDVMLDVCWALFEIRLHADPERHPDDVWSELTSAYLNIVPYPEWPWWAMRGQLADEPGYMANYAIAAILAADLRVAIRAERGDWIGGDPDWYEWASERIYRYGLERASGEVLRDVLGREPSVQALLAELARVR